MKENDGVIERLNCSWPILKGVVAAGTVIPNFGDQTVLHAGPPIKPEHMNGPMRGAVIGGLVYEGFSRAAAAALLDSGSLDLHPCHEFGVVGPMTGIVTRHMPVWVVEDKVYGNQAYATINEGLGKVLRFGASDDDVLARLKWIEETLAPLMNEVLEIHGGLELKPFLAEALRRGDEMHNRNKAATASFTREFAPDLVRKAGRDAVPVLEFLERNDHFCLNISIACSKCSTDAAQEVGQGTVVTAMTSNGRDFGIRVSGLGDRWITAPAGRAKGNYFPGYSEEDAALEMGDSYISEVVGLGGFALAAGPAIASFVGGKASEFLQWTELMYSITVAEHEQFRIPALDFRGVPLGIDVCRVIETGILPILNSGIAHKQAGKGQIGAGISSPPIECFQEANNLITELAQ